MPTLRRAAPDYSRPLDFAHPKYRLPAGVTHQAGISDIGRSTAEAMLHEYIEAAQQIEAMADTMRDRIAKLEAALKECNNDMALIGEVAATIRDKGKLVFLQIEEAALLSSDIRKLCAEFKTRAESTETKPPELDIEKIVADLPPDASGGS